jgi:hypothetical protein
VCLLVCTTIRPVRTSILTKSPNLGLGHWRRCARAALALVLVVGATSALPPTAEARPLPDGDRIARDVQVSSLLSGNSQYIVSGRSTNAVRIEIASGATVSVGSGVPMCVSTDGERIVTRTVDGAQARLLLHTVPMGEVRELPLPSGAGEQIDFGVCTPDLGTIVFTTARSLLTSTPSLEYRTYALDRSTGSTRELSTSAEAASGVLIQPQYVTTDGSTLIAYPLDAPSFGLAPTRPALSIDVASGTRQELWPAGNSSIPASSDGRFMRLSGPDVRTEGLRDFETGRAVRIESQPVGQALDDATETLVASNGSLGVVLSRRGADSTCPCVAYVIDFQTGMTSPLPPSLGGTSASFDTEHHITPDGRWLLVATLNSDFTRSLFRIKLPNPVRPRQPLCLSVGEGSPGDTAVINITNTDVTGPGYGALRSSGARSIPTRSVAAQFSSVNFDVGETNPNLAFVTIGSDGRICYDSDGGTTNVILDLAATISAANLNTIEPERLIDTR